MRRLRYQLVDVFTDEKFGGNQLAVFTNGRGVSVELMQSLAKELKLSESTFVLPPEDKANDYRVRIFTPDVELPMAGHPTIGTAFVLAKEQMLDCPQGDGSLTVRFEEGVGTIPVSLEFRDGRAGYIEMRQPLPVFGAKYTDTAVIAEMLSIDEAEIAETGLPLEVVSCGVPFLYVPVRSLEAVRAISFRLDVWQRALEDWEVPNVFVFTRQVETEGATVHSRMFAPGAGILEDPATGAASGPLGCYLFKHRLVESSDGKAEILSEQGFEMGRRSFIHIRIEHKDEKITAVRVGGHCLFMGEGYFEMAD